jgi:plasmid maintenance system antidote protein VapI
MTPTQFNRSLAVLGLTTVELAQALGITPQTVNNYAAGRSPIAGPVAFIMKVAQVSTTVQHELRKRANIGPQ